MAFAVQRTQLVGAPDWTETARFDITAKAESDIQGTPPGGPPGPLNFMLQDLLEDRFKLRAHRETRELPIYALTLARTDGKLGAGSPRVNGRLRRNAGPRPPEAAVGRLPGSAACWGPPCAACASRRIKWWRAECRSRS